MVITKEEVKKAKTPKGGYTGNQARLAAEWLGEAPNTKGWTKRLRGMVIEDEQWSLFFSYRTQPFKKNKPSLLNTMSLSDSWSWKPEKTDIPALKVKSKNNKNKQRNKKKRIKVSKKEDLDFYCSREWRELRVRVLEKYACQCMMCGENPRIHGIVLHVNHIKPRSKFPELSLDFNNLQLLCEACNKGKSNKYETDWRTDETTIDEILDLEHLNNIACFTH